MLHVNAQRIETYSRCPKKSLYLWDSKESIPPIQYIVSNVIKSAYLYQIRKKKYPAFRWLSRWTDQFTREILQKPGVDPQKLYKQIKRLLAILSDWYNKIYLEEFFHDSLINVPVAIALGTHLTYYDKLELVMIGSQVQLFDFKQVNTAADYKKYTGLKIYNDLKAQIHLWSFWKAFNVVPSHLVRLVIGNQGIKPVKIRIEIEQLEKIEKYIKQIVRGIHDDVFYPSFSEQCKVCPFIQDCNL